MYVPFTTTPHLSCSHRVGSHLHQGQQGRWRSMDRHIPSIFSWQCLRFLTLLIGAARSEWNLEACWFLWYVAAIAAFNIRCLLCGRWGYSPDTEAQDSYQWLVVSQQKVAIPTFLKQQGLTVLLGQRAVVMRQIHGEPCLILS